MINFCLPSLPPPPPSLVLPSLALLLPRGPSAEKGIRGTQTTQPTLTQQQ